MKTLLVATVMIATISFAGIQTVSAHGGGNYRGGYGYCDEYDGENSAIRDRDSGDYEKFHKETSDIRREIAVKRSELRALNRQDNPDGKRAAQLTGELFDLEEKLTEKAAESGIEKRFKHGPSMMHDRGRGRGRQGRGRHMMDW